MSYLWYSRVGRKRLVAALLVAGAVSSCVNLLSSSEAVSTLSVIAALVVSAAMSAVLVKHVLSRADPR